MNKESRTQPRAGGDCRKDYPGGSEIWNPAQNIVIDVLTMTISSGTRGSHYRTERPGDGTK